ncbi:MAG: ribonuclease D [Rhodobacteraceae bacterium]|nr:ribonuclease D [Paracoccaceae bacterium]
MRTITDTESLAAFCEAARAAPYVTLDTEFLRERTYWAKLCLVQMALPGEGEAVLVDPLAEGLSLAPFYELLAHPGTVKVLHAGRQDIEIFYTEGGVIPQPLFDTQVAAMVCGFGEQVGYETLVKRIARAGIDKTSRFTDWSRRPLTEAQKAYALADVTHLRKVYEHLAAELERTGRTPWVEEELAVLTDPETYVTRPDEAWTRIRTRSNSPRFLAVVRELARFRESYAQARNIPRSRVFKDDALLELASTRPTTPEELGRSRLLLREARRGEIAEGILEAVRTALALPNDALPRPEDTEDRPPQGNPALADLLRVLLKARSDAEGVAARLIASAADLDALAAGARDLPALRGWRREVFGEDALRLCEGRIALSARGGAIRVVPL